MKNKNKKKTNFPFAIIFLEFSTPFDLLIDTDHTLWPGWYAFLVVLKDCNPVIWRKQIGLGWAFFKKKWWATYFSKEKTAGLVMLLDGPQRPHNPVYSLLLRITTNKKWCNSVVN